MEHEIQFSQNAALELVMAGLEAYQASASTSPDGPATETLGHLWGYRKRKGRRAVHVVEHVSVSILAERRASSVTNEPEVARMKTAVAGYMRPELSFLGDFHTHPFRSEAEV